MGAKYRIKARNVANVAASKTALIDLPVGKRIHTIILEHGYAAGTNTVAGAMANILDIRLLVNDRIQRVHTGVQLRDLNILNGTAYDCQGVPNTAPGVSLPIFLAEPWRKDSASQDALAWPTNNFRSMRLEVDLGAASTPTLACAVVVDDFIPGVEPLFVTVARQQFAAGGVSLDVTTLPKSGLLQQVSIYPDSGGSNAATIVTLRKDGQIWHELTKSANFALLSGNGMTPTASGRTANIYDMVMDHDDLLNSSLRVDDAKELVATIEAGSAMSGTVTALIQKFGKLA